MGTRLVTLYFQNGCLLWGGVGAVVMMRRYIAAPAVILSPTCGDSPRLRVPMQDVDFLTSVCLEGEGGPCGLWPPARRLPLHFITAPNWLLRVERQILRASKENDLFVFQPSVCSAQHDLFWAESLRWDAGKETMVRKKNPSIYSGGGGIGGRVRRKREKNERNRGLLSGTT